MLSEVLHPQTKGSTRPEGLKLEARLGLTHTDVIQAAHFLAGTMGALGLRSFQAPFAALVYNLVYFKISSLSQTR